MELGSAYNRPQTCGLLPPCVVGLVTAEEWWGGATYWRGGVECGDGEVACRVCCEMLSVPWAPKGMAASSIREKDAKSSVPKIISFLSFLGLVEVLVSSP